MRWALATGCWEETEEFSLEKRRKSDLQTHKTGAAK